jgi:SAM-dependent methyltransferase
MYHSVYDLRAFYSSKIGRVVRRVLKERIREIWPELKGLRIAGCGYAIPYLRTYKDEAERVFAIMPAGQGAHAWPYNSPADVKNLVCVSEEAELPIETNSVDRVILIHSLEFSEHLKSSLQEVWRILKSNGRLLVIVPNRSGLWVRTDWSPFGHGTPYTASQIKSYLRDNQFIYEQTAGALFMPPVKYSLFLQSAGFFEEIGRRFMPIAAGVHIVEATKQIYARADTNSGSKVRVRRRDFLPQPVPQNRV